jgi:cyclopropane-fatty-acyl-phospholipid synthase
MTAMAANSDLSLEGYDNICMHYRFNDAAAAVRSQGFDDVFIRCWNYYFTYCEAGFHSGTEGCLILVFSRPGNAAVVLPGSLTSSILARNASS